MIFTKKRCCFSPDVLTNLPLARLHFIILYFNFADLENKTGLYPMHGNGISEAEQKVFSVIRELIPFLDFVKNHPATIPGHKTNADRIQDIIQNIAEIKESRSWCISFAVYSEKLLRDPKEGLCRYDWRASLESGILSIEAERRFYPFSVKTLNYVYSFHYNFRNGRLADAGENDFSVFLEDVLKYKDYVNAKLPDIETEIELF